MDDDDDDNNSADLSPLEVETIIKLRSIERVLLPLVRQVSSFFGCHSHVIHPNQTVGVGLACRAFEREHKFIFLVAPFRYFHILVIDVTSVDRMYTPKVDEIKKEFESDSGRCRRRTLTRPKKRKWHTKFNSIVRKSCQRAESIASHRLHRLRFAVSATFN